MPKISSAPTAVAVLPAEVIAIYPADRVVDIRWLSQEGGKRGVVVTSSHGDYSFPAVGDTGLVLQYGFNFFYIGRIDISYAAKLAGNVRSKLTGQKLRPTEVDGGEAHLENVAAKSYVRFSNNGDFSLLNAFREGLKYMRNLRRTTISAKTMELFGNGIKIMFGTAIRNPGTGEIPPPGTSGGKVIEFLLQIAYQDIQTVRFHLGEIVDLIAGTVPEMSSFGARLKALLEVTAGPAPLASLKMDEVGNVEVTSATGQIKTSSLGPTTIDSKSTLSASAIGIASIDGQLVQLGGSVEQVIKGTSYVSKESEFLTQLNTFTAALTGFFSATALSLTDPVLASAAGAMAAPAATFTAAVNKFLLTDLPATLSTKTFVG